MAKYNKKVVSQIVELLRSDTYTIIEVCRIVGISQRTFYAWQSEYPDFQQAVQEAKDERVQFFVKEAKKSLLKKIQGYEVEEVKTVSVGGKQTDEEGNPAMYVKEQTITTKHIQPDTSAIIFTLTNCDPENWKNKHSNEVAGKDGKDLFMNISDEELDKKIQDLERKLKE